MLVRSSCYLVSSPVIQDHSILAVIGIISGSLCESFAFGFPLLCWSVNFGPCCGMMRSWRTGFCVSNGELSDYLSTINIFLCNYLSHCSCHFRFCSVFIFSYDLRPSCLLAGVSSQVISWTHSVSSGTRTGKSALHASPLHSPPSQPDLLAPREQVRSSFWGWLFVQLKVTSFFLLLQVMVTNPSSVV